MGPIPAPAEFARRCVTVSKIWVDLRANLKAGAGWKAAAVKALPLVTGSVVRSGSWGPKNLIV